jgi:SpoVK/Ycf46/Vps4 family AAA+-type ATPase
MDGVSSMSQVIVVAATNRPQVLDAALVRPGRLDRLIYVGLPDTGARLSIWRSVLSKIPHEVPDSGPESISGLAERTEGYTGAEIVMIAKEAAILCIREQLTVNESQDLSAAFDSLSIDSTRQPLHQILSHRHILDVLKGTQPRTDPDLVEALVAFKEKRL